MSSLEANYRVSNMYITAQLPSFLANPPCLLLSARLLAMHRQPAGLGPNFRESFILALLRPNIQPVARYKLPSTIM